MLFSFIRPDKKCKRFRALRIHPCKCIMILSRFCAVRIVGIANAHFREKSFSLSHKIALFSHHTVYCFYLYCNLNYKKCFCIILSIFILRAAAFYRFLLKKIFMNPMLYHLLHAINFFHFNAPSLNMNFIRHKRISTCA